MPGGADAVFGGARTVRGLTQKGGRPRRQASPGYGRETENTEEGAVPRGKKLTRDQSWE